MENGQTQEEKDKTRESWIISVEVVQEKTLKQSLKLFFKKLFGKK